MPLPDLIEIVPLKAMVKAALTVPGSKSITNRALILAALADGETTLTGALWSEDTQVLVESLQELGFMVNVAPDPQEICNRTITVYGKGGLVPQGGTETQPLDLFVGNAGTAARFLTAFLCLGRGVYRLQGVARMHERPQRALFSALRTLGYRLDSPNDKLPVMIHGSGPRPGKCRVSIQESSQFASALLLGSRVGGWQVVVEGDESEEASYVSMTSKLIEAFPNGSGKFAIEPDASSGSYFWAVDWLRLPELKGTDHSAQRGAAIHTTYPTNITVANWPRSGWQIDESFPKMLCKFVDVAGLATSKAVGANKTLNAVSPREFSRKRDLGDSIMTAIVIAPIAAVEPASGPVSFTDLGRLRLQECERVAALRTELSRCGARVVETGDTLEVFHSNLHGAEIETYNDHRMAMCFAILGLKVPGIRIKNPGCVKKTFPNFFNKLAASPPAGLGATVVNARTGRQLGPDELFAD
ncbi:MAG TPA: hypothetical protein VKY92_25305 [Verrucomicrobiae bacterium]|nr:hypothetical protein [Verrucomicrobiae bacterium]